MAHQTATAHRVQIPQHWLELGTTMKRTGLAKKMLVVLDKCNSLSMAQHTRKTTRWSVTHKHMLEPHVHLQTPVLFASTQGDHQEGTVEENNERHLNYLESGFGSSRGTSLMPSLTNLNAFQSRTRLKSLDSDSSLAIPVQSDDTATLTLASACPWLTQHTYMSFGSCIYPKWLTFSSFNIYKGPFRGSVSCPRTLLHADVEDWGLNHRPTNWRSSCRCSDCTGN